MTDDHPDTDKILADIDQGGSEADIALGYLRDAAAQIDAIVPRISTRDVDAVNEDWAEVIRLAAVLAGFVRDLCSLGEQGEIPSGWLRARYGQPSRLPAVREAPGVDERPPGFWGRVELPGYRNHTGWITDEPRFGQQMCVVRDWDGIEVAAVAIGPACQVIHLATPRRRPDPATGNYQESRMLLDGRDRDDGDPFGDVGADIGYREEPF